MSNGAGAAVAKPQIQSLQVFRGIAALAVVAHHATNSTAAFVGGVPAWAKSVFGLGYLGVDFFFVLSGFIIMYAHFADDGTGPAVRRYVFKRLVRIFPAYLPISLALIALYAALPGFSGASDRGYSLLSSLLLLPADGPPALSVAWTLVHELMFYAVFSLFFISSRWLVLGLTAWAALILVSQQVLSPTGWLRYPLSVLNIEFMLGVLAAWTVKSWALRRRLTNGWGWMAFTGALVLCMGLALILGEPRLYHRLVFSLGLALIIVGFSVREQSARLHWPSLLLLMGNASYSIYLVHNPLLSVTQRLAGRLDLAWGGSCYSAWSARYWQAMFIAWPWNDLRCSFFKNIQSSNNLCAVLPVF